jgi:3-deoxy-manno-octulosonate cytidylyltransferase (CMP-KDO synthetase)
MDNHRSIIGIIPARYGSTRLPAKPLIDLCGKPMIQHVYERARRSTLLQRLIVATDHPAIEAAVKAIGGEAVMTPESLQSGSDRVAHVAKELPQSSIIVNIQGDEPLIHPEMIDEAIRPLIANPTVTLGTLVTPITDPDVLLNPSVVKVVLDRMGFALYFSRSVVPFLRDGSPQSGWPGRQLFYKHLGLYVYIKEVLLAFSGLQQTPLEQAEKLEQLRFLEHGYKIFAAVTQHDTQPIDTADDVEAVKRVLRTEAAH